MLLDSERRSFRDGNRRRSPNRTQILMVNARVNEQRRARNHKIGAIVLTLIALAGLGWATVSGASWMGTVLYSNNDVYTIRKIDIVSNGRLKAEHIREYGRFSEGMNLFELDIEKIRRDLEHVPLVRSAEVVRQLPDTLIVRVTERAAIARIGRDDRKYFLAVDRDGYVLGPTARSPHLPVITGVDDAGLTPGSVVKESSVADALVAIDICDEPELSHAVKIVSLDVDRPDFLDIRLAQGERVLLSRENMKTKLTSLADILTTAANSGDTVESVDLTVERNFPVRYREREVEAHAPAKSAPKQAASAKKHR
jgi:cell division protein FtsQ